MVFKNITLTLLTGYIHSNIIITEDQCTALIGAGRKTRVHQERGGSPLFLFLIKEAMPLRELSIFIDESGDFGEYDYHSPYYIISMVFHNQETDISEPLEKLNTNLRNIDYPNHCIHTGPIIRRENEYEFESIENRRRIFNFMVTFIKHIDIRYKCFFIEKKHFEDSVEAVGNLSKQISIFIRDHYSDFLAYNTIKVYYDNGQTEVSKLLSTVFNALLPSVQIKKVIPSDYRLFQTADLFCSMELVRLKVKNNIVSASEMEFFGNLRDLKKNYLKPLHKKEWI
jgi:hypothetical protein